VPIHIIVHTIGRLLIKMAHCVYTPTPTHPLENAPAYAN